MFESTTSSSRPTPRGTSRRARRAAAARPSAARVARWTSPRPVSASPAGRSPTAARRRSKTPRCDALGLTDWRYQLLPVPPERFAETVTALPGAGFRGINVTIPHKAGGARAGHGSRPSARSAIGAANTLVFEPDGRIKADNTDAPGLIAALPFAPAGRTALVLGAGGSARAVVWALLDAGAREISDLEPDAGARPCAGRGARRRRGRREAAAGRPARASARRAGSIRREIAFKPLPIDADDVSELRMRG